MEGMILGPDGKPLIKEHSDTSLLEIVWRGSNVLIATNRDAIKRLSFDDKRRIAEQLQKVFVKDFGVLI